MDRIFHHENSASRNRTLVRGKHCEEKQGRASMIAVLVGTTTTRWAKSLVVAWTATAAQRSAAVEFSSLSLTAVRYYVDVILNRSLD